jgi:putative transposase
VARLPRVVMPGFAHLVVHRGLNEQIALLDEVDRKHYLASFRTAAAESGVAIHAYSLFDGEVRMLLTPAGKEGLAKMMQAVGRRYVPVFNRRHARHGSPWEGRFRSTVLEASKYFFVAACFVERPFFQAQIASPLSVRSSVAHHLGLDVDALITEHPMYWSLGNTPFEREVAYRRLLESPADAAVDALVTDSTLRGWPLGSVEFTEEIAAIADRRTTRNKPGRPPKTRSDPD